MSFDDNTENENEFENGISEFIQSITDSFVLLSQFSWSLLSGKQKLDQNHNNNQKHVGNEEVKRVKEEDEKQKETRYNYNYNYN